MGGAILHSYKNCPNNHPQGYPQVKKQHKSGQTCGKPRGNKRDKNPPTAYAHTHAKKNTALSTDRRQNLIKIINRLQSFNVYTCAYIQLLFLFIYIGYAWIDMTQETV